MKNVDIMEGIQSGIETVLFKGWKHTGYIDLMYSDEIYFCVDGNYYILKLKEESKEQFKNRHKSLVDEYNEELSREEAAKMLSKPYIV